MATPPTATGTVQGTPLRSSDEKDQPLGKFRVKGKYIHRASIVALKMGEKADGTPNIVNQPGPMQLLEVGTELDDVQEHELKAFPDRFEPVDDQAKKTVLRLHGIPEEAQEQQSVDELLAAPLPLGTPSSPADKDEPPQPVEPSAEEKALQAEERRRAQQSRRGESSSQSRQGEPPAPPRPGEPPAPPSPTPTPPRPGEPPAAPSPTPVPPSLTPTPPSVDPAQRPRR